MKGQIIAALLYAFAALAMSIAVASRLGTHRALFVVAAALNAVAAVIQFRAALKSRHRR